jgi:hypothetical protein
MGCDPKILHWAKDPRTFRKELQEWESARVPNLPDVLHSLMSDASCYDSARDFKDFCYDFGYSDDSIRARDIYLACGETSKRIQAFLGCEFGAFAMALEDY